MTPLEALEKAVAIAGGQSALARKSGLSQPRIWYWLRKRRACTAEAAHPIERATGGRVTAGQLRPDLFGRGAR